MPDVDVDDGERRGDGPGVDEFAVFPNGGVGEKAVGACFDPQFDVVAHFVPEEAEANAVECFVNHEMAGRRGGVKELEDTTAEAGWRDNEEETAPGEAERLGVDKTAVMQPNKTGAERAAVTGRQLANKGFRELVVRVGGQRGVNGVENGVRSISCGPFGGCGERLVKDAGENLFGGRGVRVKRWGEGDVVKSRSKSRSEVAR